MTGGWTRSLSWSASYLMYFSDHNLRQSTGAYHELLNSLSYYMSSCERSHEPTAAINTPVLVPVRLRYCTCLQKYCGSVSCPRGYVEIDNADYVKCDYCSQDNCCDRLCSSYLCPNGYVEDPHEFTSKCEDSKCTVSQCCIYRPRWCSSFLCPHSLALVDHASRKKCLDGKCTAERCCVDKPGKPQTDEKHNAGRYTST